MKRLIPWLAAPFLWAQPYDLLLKGGHVLDPGNVVDGVNDVAVAGNRIVAVARDIPESAARQVIDVAGYFVTPGLIDLHTHVYLRGRSATVFPDDAVLPRGTTTIVDAGVSGWRTFEDFKETIIDRSKTRVLALLNIVGGGMNNDARKEDNVEDMDPEKTAAMIGRYPQILVGVKTAHFGLPGWTALERAVAAGRLAGKPVMADSHIYSSSGRNTRKKVLEILRPGDLHTHIYNDQQLELIGRFDGKVQPYMWEARKRGVLFDLGHGGGSFLWPVASRAIAQGFPPDVISTDLHPGSILTLQVDMPNCMSKLMNLGMPLQEAVLRATVQPARAMGRYPELGTLGVGKTADIGVFALRMGVFAFIDSAQKKLTGSRKLECMLTVRDGKVVWNPEGRGAPAWNGIVKPGAVPGRGIEIVQPQAATEVFDLLLKNGWLMDRGGRFDIGITGARISRIAKGLPPSAARKVVDVSEYFVTPGLIDLHTHLDFHGSRGVPPDYHCLSSGVTTAVDLDGGAPRRSRTRVVAAAAVSGMPERKPFLFTSGLPDVISTGMDRESILREQATMSVTMSKWLNLGVPFAEIIDLTTRRPAELIRQPELGRLKESGGADIAAFEIREGRFGFVDAAGERLDGRLKIVCVLTIRDGAVAWDLNGLTLTEWTQAGAYSNYR
jgi:dihydroorotase